MKKHRQYMIALAMATLAGLPWRVFNRSAGAEKEDEQWYRIDNNASDPGKPIEVLVYGEIGDWGITAEQFFRDLAAVDDGSRQIHVGFNSNGGDISDGFAMHNGLSRLGERCVGRIDGFALSAAGIAVTGCHKVLMADNAMFMMHNPMAWTGGDSDVFRKMADVLDQLVNGIIASFKHRPITASDDELRRMINAETWLTAAEAKDLGFVDEILAGSKPVTNHGDTRILNRYQNIPEVVKAVLKDEPVVPEVDPEPDPDPEPDNDPPDMVALAALATAECAKAGIADQAQVIIQASGLKDEASVRAAVKQAKDVRALCIMAKQPDLAPDFIKDGLSPDLARGKLFDKLVANSGKVEISNHPAVDDQPAPSVKAVNPSAVYAARRNKNASKGAQA